MKIRELFVITVSILLVVEIFSSPDCDYANDHQYSFLPTWCRHKNPFSRVPKNFPQFLMMDFQQRLGIGGSLFNYTLNLNGSIVEQYLCDGKDPHSECTYVKNVGLMDLGKSGIFIVVALVRGQIFTVNVKTGKSYVIEENFENLDLFLSFGENSTNSGLALSNKILDSNGVVTSQEVYFYSVNYYGNYSNLCFSKQISSDRYLYDMKYVTANGKNYLVLFFVKNNDVLIEFNWIYGCSHVVEGTWTISNFEKLHNGRIGFDYFYQNINFNLNTDSLAIEKLSDEEQTLILLQDKRRIHVIRCDVKDFVFNFQSNLWSEFYEEIDSSRELVLSKFIDHKNRRIRFGSSSCGMLDEYDLSQPVNVFVVSKNVNRSFVKTVNLQEFSESYFNTNDINHLNPVNRSSFCVNGYFNGTGCEKRNFLELSFEGNVVKDVKVSYTSILSSNYDNEKINLEYLCEFYYHEYNLDVNVLKECLNLKHNCEFEKLNNHTNLRKIILNNYYYSNIFLVTDSNKIVVLSHGLEIDPNNEYIYPFQFYLKEVSNFHSEGKIRELVVSENSNHIFLVNDRKKWILDTKTRRFDVCLIFYNRTAVRKIKESLTNDLMIDFLDELEEQCEENPPSKVNVMDFAMYASNCKDGIHCPYFKSFHAENVPHKYFSEYPIIKQKCPSGFWCLDGFREKCPRGFYCPEFQDYPLICTKDDMKYKTCFSTNNVINGVPCPVGHICEIFYETPILIPPGYQQNLTSYYEFLKYYEYYEENYDQSNYEEAPTFVELLGYEEIFEQYTNPNVTLNEVVQNHFNVCELKKWCPLGIFWDNLCPSGAFCVNSSVLLPTACLYEFPSRKNYRGFSEYCPEGTYFNTSSQRACPVGYQCHGPLGDSIKKCEEHFYCPQGTFNAEICPPKYYCSTPSEKKLCPWWHYCPQGSIRPRLCSIFSICPSGTEKDRINFGGYIAIFMIMVVCYSVYRFGGFVYRMFKKKRFYYDEIPKQYWDLINKVKIQGIVEEEDDDELHVDLGFQDLKLSLKVNGVTVLSGVSGEINHGEVTAVMGLSGCGKSTFITTLANRAYYGITSGKIFISGVEEKLNQLNKFVAFVPQEDVMIRTAKVEEILYFSARTRCDRRLTKKEINKKVDRVIDILGLKNIRGSVIGDENVRGISGGQRKRVNIGIELVSDPKVLFADEPTSGLDSSSSQQVCDSLRRIASELKIPVICVIHQPRYEIFEQFDNLLLLGNGGNVVYMGKVEKARSYFEELGFFIEREGVNPADFMMDCVDGKVESRKGKKLEYWNQEQFFECWEENNESKVFVEKDPEKKKEFKKKFREMMKSRKKSYLIQTFQFLKRSVVLKIRDINGFFLDNALVLIGGLFLGILFANEKYIGSLPKQIYNDCPEIIRGRCMGPVSDPLLKHSSLISLILGLCGMMNSLSTFGKNKANFIREQQAGLSTFSYFLASNISDLINIVVSPIIFLGVYYTLKAPRGILANYLLILILFHYTSFGLGYLVSIVFPASSNKIAGVVIILILFLFAGLSTSVRVMKMWTPPLNYIHWLSYFRFSTESLYLIEIIRIKDFHDIEKGMLYYGYDTENVYWVIPMIFVHGTVFRILAYICLVSSVPDSKFHSVKSWIQFKKFQSKKWFEGMILKFYSRKVYPKVNIVDGDETPLSENMDGSFSPVLSCHDLLTYEVSDNEGDVTPLSPSPSFDQVVKNEIDYSSEKEENKKEEHKDSELSGGVAFDQIKK